MSAAAKQTGADQAAAAASTPDAPEPERPGGGPAEPDAPRSRTPRADAPA